MCANTNSLLLMFSPEISSLDLIYVCLMKIMIGDNMEDQFVVFRWLVG